MNLQLDTVDARHLLNEMGSLFPDFEPQIERLDIRAGLYVDIEPVDPISTDDQREGLHVLLTQWMRMDRRITADINDLRHWCCLKKFGAVVKTLPDGQEIKIPARTTTKRWDHNRRRYVRSKLSRSLYSELIDSVFILAAERGSVLKDLERVA